MKKIDSSFLNFGLVSFPISIYSLKDNSESVSFHRVSNCCNDITGIKTYCKKCGNNCEIDEHIKFYTIGKNQNIAVPIAELEKAQEKVKGIYIEGFLPLDKINERELENPYSIQSDSAIYLALNELMYKNGVVALAELTMRGNTTKVILTGNLLVGLICQKITKNQFIEFAPKDTTLKKDELQLFEKLINKRMLDKVNYKTARNEKFKEIIQAVAQGKEIKIEHKVAELDNLKAMLEKALEI